MTDLTTQAAEATEAGATAGTPAHARIVNGIAVPSAGTYVLDPAHTRVGFLARHLMVTKVRGAFREFEGSITVGEDIASSTATATIQTASIDTGVPDRDKHLRSGDFFEIEKYPTISFGNAQVVSWNGSQATVVGDLTIKDVTREVTLDVELDGVATDPFGNQKLALTATTEINREDFGMTWNVAVESGGVLVSKKIVIEIEAQAVRQA